MKNMIEFLHFKGTEDENGNLIATTKKALYKALETKYQLHEINPNLDYSIYPDMGLGYDFILEATPEKMGFAINIDSEGNMEYFCFNYENCFEGFGGDILDKHFIEYFTL